MINKLLTNDILKEPAPGDAQRKLVELPNMLYVPSSGRRWPNTEAIVIGIRFRGDFRMMCHLEILRLLYSKITLLVPKSYDAG